tara:strand:- start:2131 stop:2826 length:696 start_codon:yes stop_codon:yes gene_type:complete
VTKILAITLARGGSKKIKNKNIVLLNKKPLIYYTIKEAKKSKWITDYIISTDSLKISKISKKYGVDVPFLRPKSLSGDKSKSIDALLHALNFMENLKGHKYDFIIELMATNPLKTFKDIDNIISIMVRKKYDSVIAVHRLFDQHPARIKKIVKNKLVDFNFKEPLESRRQDLKPHAFIRSGSIYGMSRKFLNKKLRFRSGISVPYVLDPNKVVNIDEPEDLLLAKSILNEK